MGRSLAMRARDELEAHDRAAEPDAQPNPAARSGTTVQYRVVVFGRARGPWRATLGEARQDAIDQDLAAWDEYAGEHFIAVPTDIQTRLV